MARAGKVFRPTRLATNCKRTDCWVACSPIHPLHEPLSQLLQVRTQAYRAGNHLREYLLLGRLPIQSTLCISHSASLCRSGSGSLLPGGSYGTLAMFASFASHVQPVQVRTQAYRALAAYSLEDLDSLELTQPCGDAAQLLLQERDPAAQQACQALVVQGLAFEHAHRRRWVCFVSGCLSFCLTFFFLCFVFWEFALCSVALLLPAGLWATGKSRITLPGDA